MNRFSTAAFCLLMMTAPLLAKGHTVKITVKGTGLQTPIEITDDRVGLFHVWSGPGVFVNDVEESEGFIIDWWKGIAEKMPAGLPQYEVSFFSGCNDDALCPADKPRLTYVVLYSYDPTTEQGFVYLPGRSDELFKFNHAMWHGRGFEGNWLFATSAWESFVRPIIAKA
jgi:hypothetical protein